MLFAKRWTQAVKLPIQCKKTNRDRFISEDTPHVSWHSWVEINIAGYTVN